MPTVYPFRAVQYAAGLRGHTDVSPLVAPPYDVLDPAGKHALLKRSEHNIVAVDLPHIPAKELGPPAAYEHAAALYRQWLAGGTLVRRDRPAMFVYRETFQSDGKRCERTGMACCIETLPFGPRAGGGVLPHEETFSGPKEDRMALMKATRTQLSPIFGLHADATGKASALLRQTAASRKPDCHATTADGTLHEVWAVEDQATLAAYAALLAGEDVFIADGHHRYTTGLNYLKGLGDVPADHPARRCMIVLVSMNDPGMVIWPTHRVLGGMKDYSIDKFLSAGAGHLRLEPIAGDLTALDRALQNAGAMGERRFALWDCSSRKGYLALPAHDDPLAARFPEKPRAWRDLTVAFCQYVLVEEICQKALNAGSPVKWAFPHTIKEVEDIGAGRETGAGGGSGFAQLAVIVRPTPLDAVRDVSRANQLMPQKSTFFYPKLATGLFMNPLE
jgi:uncharacterized protein (DUF1015 family)